MRVPEKISESRLKIFLWFVLHELVGLGGLALRDAGFQFAVMLDCFEKMFVLSDALRLLL